LIDIEPVQAVLGKQLIFIEIGGTAVVITFVQSQLTSDQLASPTILPMEE